MSEQPPLYQQNTLNAAAGSRINDSHMMSVPYYVYLKTPAPFASVECPRTQPPVQRLDGMSLNPSAAVPIPANYYQYVMRPPDHVNYLYRMQQMPVFCQSILRQYPETQIPNQMTSSVDYGSMGFPPQTYQPMYPPTAHSSQPLPNNTPTQRSIPPVVPVTPPYRKSRERCPLLIKDPATGASIDLASQPKPQDSQPTQQEESSLMNSEPTSSLDLEVKEVIHEPVVDLSPSIQISPEVVHDEEAESENKELEQKTDEQSQLHGEIDEPVLENGSSVDAAVSMKVIDDFIKAESGEDTDDSDAEDAAYRRIYPREFLLTCKDSPVARVPLQDLAAYFADYSRPRKGHRNTNRAAPQRIIRLPTGITVKRVEGAFVPSHLRKKENAETDHHKVLSRELNVILNRVSDGNLSESISDIKKLNISSPEDLQLLAKLVFQKSIRQPKYSKVFSTLCKELKGFEVSGCEPFEVLIFRQAQELFHTPLETLISELNAALDAKIAAAKDEAVKRVLEDGRDTNIVKKTEAYYGNITFLAELFLCRLVTPRTMTKCLNDLRDSPAPEALNSMLILLRTCGQELEQQSKNIVDSCFSRLNGHMKSNKLPTHQVYKIQELIDIRERGWKEMDHSQAPPPDALVKRSDEKVRWPYGQPPTEPKRKPTQAVNPLTPSSLAVTQQSLDARKLGPAHANWSQGSGLLSKNPEDKEGAPRPSANLSSAFRQPGVSFAQTLRPKEDYESVLKRTAGSARTVVATLKANEDNMYMVFEECKPEERSALLHGVLERLMDERSQTRSAAGLMCLQLLNKRLLTPSDMISACERYLPNCTGDWLEDYPHGWRYLAEIFQHLLQKDQDYFPTLLGMLKILKSEGRGASILAHCLSQSAARLGSDCVAAKFHTQRLEWSRLGVPPSDVENFVKRHSVEFTQTPNPLEIKLKELAEIAASPSASLEQFTNIFKPLYKPDLPGGFVRSCAKTLISKSKGLSRQQIDHRVTGLGILVDHSPDRELQVLQALHECSNSGFPTELWQKSLLDKKVISTDALDSWTKSSNSKESVSGHIPIRNK